MAILTQLWSATVVYRNLRLLHPSLDGHTHYSSSEASLRMVRIQIDVIGPLAAAQYGIRRHPCGKNDDSVQGENNSINQFGFPSSVIYFKTNIETVRLTTWNPSNSKVISLSCRIQPIITASGRIPSSICMLLLILMAKLVGISSLAARMTACGLHPNNGKRMRPMKLCVKTFLLVRPSILSTANVVFNTRKTVIMVSVNARAGCDIFGKGIHRIRLLRTFYLIAPPADAANPAPIWAITFSASTWWALTFRSCALICGVVNITECVL